MPINKISRRSLFKTALGASATLVGFSALKPLYASEAMDFKGPDVPDVAAIKVNDRCYYIPASGPLPTSYNLGFFSNPSFIITAEGVVVVDTGASVQIGEMLLRQIRKITTKPIIKIINTHFHGDHWLGNHAFVVENPEIKIYAHPKTQAKLKAGADEFWFGFMQQNTNNKITGTIMTLPDQDLIDGEIIKLGDTTLKIHHFGTMHTDADLIVEIVEDKTMIMGDAVMRRVANMEDASFVGTIKGLENILAMPVDTFIPMHGKHEGTALIEDGKQFMEIIYNETARLYEEGLADFEIRPIIMENAFMKNEASKWPGYQSTLGRFVAVAVREYEASLF